MNLEFCPLMPKRPRCRRSLRGPALSHRARPVDVGYLRSAKPRHISVECMKGVPPAWKPFQTKVGLLKLRRPLRPRSTQMDLLPSPTGVSTSGLHIPGCLLRPRTARLGLDVLFDRGRHKWTCCPLRSESALRGSAYLDAFSDRGRLV